MDMASQVCHALILCPLNKISNARKLCDQSDGSNDRCRFVSAYFKTFYARKVCIDKYTLLLARAFNNSNARVKCNSYQPMRTG